MPAQLEVERPIEHPLDVESQVYSLLFPQKQIQEGVKDLAGRLFANFQERGIDEVVAVYVMDGAMYFATDLLHYLSTKGMKWIRTETVNTETYQGTTSTERPVLTKKTRRSLKGKHVLLIEDVLDTGATLNFLQGKLMRSHPASLTTALLVTKTTDALTGAMPAVDDVVFPNVRGWVVGYGFDVDGYFRELPDIYVKSVVA